MGTKTRVFRSAAWRRPQHRIALLLAALLLAACGGGGGGGSSSITPPVGGSGGSGGSGVGWTPGVFQPAANFANRCAAPRPGAFPDVQGTTVDENNWLRSWSHDLYLWYDEIVDRNPASFGTHQYFELLKTDALTPSGRPKDDFHFHMPTHEWEALSQSGVSAGYGASWAILAAAPPREILVAFTEPNTPATEPTIDLVRGARVLAIDGVDAVNDNTQVGVDTLNAGLFPGTVGASHTFTIQDPDADHSRNVTLTTIEVTSTPVQNVGTVSTASGEVGYMLFNDHNATAEPALIDAITQLGDAGVTDLVLDIRYNGGGFLAIASQLAYMIAGPDRTAGRRFERLRFNDKHPTTNPVTGETLTPMPFYSVSSTGQPLPTLGLPRVFVLTGSGTCSASESVMNGLLGVDVEVIQIGATTCGKPFGFYPTDNCGTTYFTIQFQGENDQGFGEYPDGFGPAGAAGMPSVVNPGCPVTDDFTRPLGDAAEGRLAAALAWRESSTCPAPASLALKSAAPSSGAWSAAEPTVPRPHGLRGKILAQ